jgi:hypothetical protein
MHLQYSISSDSRPIECDVPMLQGAQEARCDMEFYLCKINDPYESAK